MNMYYNCVLGVQLLYILAVYCGNSNRTSLLIKNRALATRGPKSGRRSTVARQRLLLMSQHCIFLYWSIGFIIYYYILSIYVIKYAVF